MKARYVLLAGVFMITGCSEKSKENNETNVTQSVTSNENITARKVYRDAINQNVNQQTAEATNTQPIVPNEMPPSDSMISSLIKDAQCTNHALIELIKEKYKASCKNTKILTDIECEDIKVYIGKCGIEKTVVAMPNKLVTPVTNPTTEPIVVPAKLNDNETNTTSKTKQEDDFTVLKIFKYGDPHGIGTTYINKATCELAQEKFTKDNASMGYTYTCVKLIGS